MVIKQVKTAWFAITLLVGLTVYAAADATAASCPSPIAEINGPTGRPLSVDEGRGRDRLLYEESHALLIGESNYAKSSGWRALNSVPAELDRLATALNEQGFHVVRYDNLSSAQLTLAIECFVKAYGYRRDARILIYFAGHGFTRIDKQSTGERTVGYVLPVDAPRQPVESGGAEEAALIAKALRLTQFQEWAGAMEARHVLLIFDSCFSGAVLGHKGGDLTLQKPQPLNYVLSDKAQSPVRWFLTSGTANQTVPAESYFNSLLVQALSGLRPEADANHDGFLTSRELVNYLTLTVPNYNPDQTPDEGKIRDALLDVGDMAFRLPDRESAAKVLNMAAQIRSYRRIGGGSEESADNSGKDVILPRSLKVASEIASLPVAQPPAPAVLPGEDLDALAKAVQELESNDTGKRRKARATLSKLIGTNGDAFVGELVRGLPHGSYRFQLGVAQALATSPNGLRANDQDPALKIVRERAAAARDTTLKNALNGALRNVRP